MIQQYTDAIGLVESDDAKSEPDVVKTQPTSAKSKISEVLSNKEMVESYVEDQTRRTSGKTNSHILSDTDNNPNSLGSTPMHLPNNPTSSEIEHVRSEIAQMQSDIADVKKEMVEMQRQQAATPSPAHHASRPQSVTSDKTFVYEDDAEEPESSERPITNQDKSRASTPKTILKPQSAFQRTVNPLPDNIINDDELEDSAEEEILHNEDAITSQGMDEVDQSPQIEAYDPMTDSAATVSKDNEIDYDDDEDATIEPENDDYEQAFSPPPEDEQIAYQKTACKVKRQPPLKRSHKVTPVKNVMPNIHQQSTVPGQTKPQKVSNALYPPTLRRFDRPKDAIQSCLAELDSSSWENVMDGLKIFVRLIRHHPEVVDAQIHLMTLALSRHVKNLRSQVSRAGNVSFFVVFESMLIWN